jgi:hypothetical protein
LGAGGFSCSLDVIGKKILLFFYQQKKNYFNSKIFSSFGNQKPDLDPLENLNPGPDPDSVIMNPETLVPSKLLKVFSGLLKRDLKNQVYA